MDETQKVDFIAIHPSSIMVADGTCKLSVANQSSQTAIDLLYATADKSGSGYDKNDGRNNTVVNFTFDHKLAKLIFTAVPGTGLPVDLSAMTVNITGMSEQCEIDLDGSVNILGSFSGSLTPFRRASTDIFEAILFPVDALHNSHTVEFIVDGETYIWEMWRDIPSLEEGKIYEFDVTVTKYDVNAVGSINKWTIGNTGSGTAD